MRSSGRSARTKPPEAGSFDCRAPAFVYDGLPMVNTTPRKPPPTSYKGRTPASAKASAAARGSSKKTDTACEQVLRSTLWKAGLRYRKNVSSLPGHPDIIFTRAKVAVFCDGDFWHGRDWETRRQKLTAGSNAEYWLAKIQRNMERDRETTARLESLGWRVLRFWESEIKAGVQEVTNKIKTSVAAALDNGGKMP
jgi:DNA mismatch endonuclease, patch repair protein